MPRRSYPDLLTFFHDNPDVTGERIAADVGCAPSYLSMIKWRERTPVLPLALKISSRCNVPLESLIRKPLRKAS